MGAGSLRLLILAGSEFRAGKWAAANSAPGLVSKCRFSVGIFFDRRFEAVILGILRTF